MIIFYTIEIQNDFKNIIDAPYCFFQIAFSVFSIRESGWKDIIIIYTNMEEKFKKIFFKYDNIEYRQMPENYKKWAGSYFGNYCHSRCFLISDLLKEFKKPILYLDPDTGIKKGCREEYWKGLLKKKNPIFYRPETYNNFLFWCIPQLLEDIWPSFKKDFKIPSNAYVINNGIMFFPYNWKGIKTAKNYKKFIIN